MEVASIGPGPFAGLMLADAGADVIRIQRPDDHAPVAMADDPLARGRRSIVVDLKKADGANVILRLLPESDALIEGFRPGVAERLNIGPGVCLSRNPSLVYGRMTGWGQEGPLSPNAGHDINYLALSGGLHPIGAADEPPPPPLNYVADYGGGGMLLAFGIVSAVLWARQTGEGQIVDAAMIDGVAAQTALHRGLMQVGEWQDERESNLLDGAAPFYRCYECADGRFIAVGALEPKFYAEFLDRLDLNHDEWPQQERERWSDQRNQLAAIFATKTQHEWMALFADADCCVSPVLSLGEAPDHVHHRARSTFLEHDGQIQHAPAPRFSRTASNPGPMVGREGEHTDEILSEAGFTDAEILDLRSQGAVH